MRAKLTAADDYLDVAPTVVAVARDLDLPDVDTAIRPLDEAGVEVVAALAGDLGPRRLGHPGPRRRFGNDIPTSLAAPAHGGQRSGVDLGRVGDHAAAHRPHGLPRRPPQRGVARRVGDLLGQVERAA